MYGLKQLGRMQYNRLNTYLFKEWYINNLISACVFIKKSKTEFATIIVYVDDLNIMETHEELVEAVTCLNKEFEMKDLGKTKFYLGL